MLDLDWDSFVGENLYIIVYEFGSYEEVCKFTLTSDGKIEDAVGLWLKHLEYLTRRYETIKPEELHELFANRMLLDIAIKTV